MSILDNYYGEGKSIRDKIEELEQENRRLSEKNKIYSNALVQEKEKKKSLKEERDNFMLEYAKALEEKVVETNKLCTERNKLEQENKKLKHKNELQEKALIKLCLKHHYDSIIIEGEEVIDMSNYKVVEKQKPQEEKLF